jgi:chromosome segregation ATPase
LEEELNASKNSAESLKKKNAILMTEIKTLKSKIPETPQTNDQEINLLNSRVQNLEAEKWAMSNESKIIQEKLQSLSKRIFELQNVEARYQVLQAEMDLKRKESDELTLQIEEMGKNHSKVFGIFLKLVS